MRLNRGELIMEYAIIDGELCHYGIPGMKWGKRTVRGHAGPGNYLTKKKRLAGDKKDLEYLNKGGHLSVGLTKKRQAAYDKRDKAALEKRIDKTEKQLNDKQRNKESKDIGKLTKLASKAQNSGRDYVKFLRENTYTTNTGNSIVINNAKLRNRAMRDGKKVDKLVNKLNKKYDKVSAIAKYDTRRGKSYVDITLNNINKKIYED